jgi:hypothetical protein
MISMTNAPCKIVALSLLIYGSITLPIAFGAGLPGDYRRFLETANGSIWKITGYLLLCVWISERIANRFFPSSLSQ